MTATSRATASLTPHIDRLVQHAGDEGSFLPKLLETQCRMAPAIAAVVIRVEANSATRVHQIYPAAAAAKGMTPWMIRAMTAAPEAALANRPRRQHLDQAGGLPDSVVNPYLLMIPIPQGRGVVHVATYVVDAAREGVLERACERLELTCGLFGLRHHQNQMRARDQVIERLRRVMEVLESVSEHEKFQASAMALCNELAARWTADRVTLGFLRGRCVIAVAMSHTERFDRKMQLVRDIESAMEECFDQDTEVVHPRPDSAIFVTRAAGELASRHGLGSSASVPLRRNGEVVGVLTIERSADHPIGLEELEELRLISDLVVPRLVDRRLQDRWIGARLAHSFRESAQHLIGPRHTWAKLTALSILVALFLAVFTTGTDHIDASFKITAVDHRVVSAPYDGRLQAIEVNPGDAVKANESILATLDQTDLQLELAAAEAERAVHLREADLALRDGKTVEVKIAQANLKRIDAKVRLLQKQIADASLTAPINGTIVSVDQKQRIGSSVKMGEVLFEIAALGALQAELEVPEDRIIDLINASAMQSGQLASVSYPGDFIPFEIEHVNPVAEVIDERNVFRVRVRLNGYRPWLRPGMQGVAKIDGGRRSYAWLWTRDVINWVRMRLWI